jgi:hypothetical protein
VGSITDINDIAAVLAHTKPLPQEANSPLLHYRRKANDAHNLLAYVERNLSRVRTYQGPRDKHLRLLSRMTLLGVVEAFERFLKETAALCIDHVAPHVADDRFADFKVHGDRLAAHFGEGSVGMALAESDTWLDCESINRRFQRVLADPFRKDTKFFLVPSEHQERGEGWRHTTLEVVFQVRHTIVHNAGVLTKSDAAKLRLLLRRHVDAPRVLWPERDDVRSIKEFLDEMAQRATDRVAVRLGKLLDEFLVSDASLFTPSSKAQEIADRMQVPFEVGGVRAIPRW